MKKSDLMMLIACCVMVAVIGCGQSETVVDTETEAAAEATVAEVAMEDARQHRGRHLHVWQRAGGDPRGQGGRSRRAAVHLLGRLHL